MPRLKKFGDRPGRKLPRVLLDATFMVAALTAFLYITGWAYLTGYYDAFDLGFNTLDLPFYTSVLPSIVPFTDVGVVLSMMIYPVLGVIALVVLGNSFHGRRYRARAVAKFTEATQHLDAFLADKFSSVQPTLGSFGGYAAGWLPISSLVCPFSSS